MSISATAVEITPNVTRFLSKPKKMLIGGEWVTSASGKTFPVYDPATGREIAQVSEGEEEDINRAVKAARKAFESGPWPKMSPAERTRLLWKLADLLEENKEEFAQLETLDNGKPITYSRAVDVALSTAVLRYHAGWATKIEGHTIPISLPGGPYHAYTTRAPIGVVGQIIPWNFPLLMASWKLGPALTCGCTVVLKPAEQTPLTALRLGELFAEAGFPPGVVNIVPGYGETAGAPLAAHPDVDKIAFTGSGEVGRLIVQASAGNLKKVSLELGGKSPNVVFDDADLEEAIPMAANAVFFNMGECCVAGARLYVQKKSFDKVVEGVADKAKKIKLGPGMNTATELGPLVSDEQMDRVTGYLKSGFEDGARAVVGGKRRGNDGYFVEPTVLVDTKPHMKIMREEIFGPVVCATPFTDLDEIARVANDTTYGLAAGIWTRDLSKAHRLASKINAGTVWINTYNLFDPAMPFGGYKESGWGREGGREVLELYTEVKTVCVKL